MVEINVVEEVKEIKEKVDTDLTLLETLKQQSKDIQEKSEDFLVKQANETIFRMNGALGLTYRTENDIRYPSLSEHALGQLCNKLTIPYSYINKCISSGRQDLAQDNVNSWLHGYNKDILVREYNGSVRGILSNKYSVCDSHEILDVVDDVLDLNQFKIKGSFLNEERLHLRMVDKTMLNVPNEDLFTGITINSSDVGRSILQVNFFLYKQVCTNGLVVSKGSGVLFQQRHIGISAEEFRSGLANSLELFPQLTQQMMKDIEDARNKEIAITRFSKEEMEQFIDKVRNQTNLSQADTEKVIDLMKYKYEKNQWGLVNSITEVAQKFTLERRLDLEKIAGSILVA